MDQTPRTCVAASTKTSQTCSGDDAGNCSFAGQARGTLPGKPCKETVRGFAGDAHLPCHLCVLYKLAHHLLRALRDAFHQDKKKQCQQVEGDDSSVMDRPRLHIHSVDLISQTFWGSFPPLASFPPPLSYSTAVLFSSVLGGSSLFTLKAALSATTTSSLK